MFVYTYNEENNTVLKLAIMWTYKICLYTMLLVHVVHF